MTKEMKGSIEKRLPTYFLLNIENSPGLQIAKTRSSEHETSTFLIFAQLAAILVFLIRIHWPN
jgi:hypothetical protein